MATTQVWASIQSVELSGMGAYLIFVPLFPLLFFGGLAAACILESIWRVQEFVADESGQVDLRSLFESDIFMINPVTGLLATTLMGLGIISCANLAEVYRATANHWYDQVLWGFEQPFFSLILGSWLDAPAFWDRIYFLIWPFLFVGMACVFKAGRQYQFLQLSLAVVLAFYLTRFTNLLFPTAGPAFFRTELFSLENTLSLQAQTGLRLYMLGLLPQNGLIPGTMAMPSLHVGLTAMAVWALGREWRWTLWLTIPWLLLIWMSTIMLGWHYALDGFGGILVASLSMLMARQILNMWHGFKPSAFS